MEANNRKLDRKGKKLWTPGKTPHSCSSLNTVSTHQTPRKRLSQIRKSQIFSASSGLLHGNSNNNMSDDSYMSYPLSPPDSHANDNKKIINELNNLNSNLNDNNMSVVANKIIGGMDNGNNNNESANKLFNISRPVFMRRYNDSTEYPFSVCPPSIVGDNNNNSNNNNNNTGMFLYIYV